MFSIMAAPAGADLLSQPWVFGPAVGLVLIVLIAAIRAFLREDIVPGSTYRRLREDNARLTNLVEAVIPLAERMTEAVERNTQTLNDVLDVIDEPRSRARSRR